MMMLELLNQNGFRWSKRFNIWDVVIPIVPPLPAKSLSHVDQAEEQRSPQRADRTGSKQSRSIIWAPWVCVALHCYQRIILAHCEAGFEVLVR